MRQSICLRVATFNVLHDPPNLSWPVRAPLVTSGLKTLGADIILLQEVAWPDEQASDLAEALSSATALHFATWVTPLITPHGWQEGLAVLTRYPVLDHATLRYPDAEQFCQRVRVDLGGPAIDIYNAHLDPYASERRQAQVTSILREMQTHVGVAGTVFGGDLNATPTSEELRPLRAFLRSAHTTVHGREPAGTFPTPVRRGSGAMNQVVDYLWHSSTLSVRNCWTIFSQPDPHDPLLYASDHVGIAADFCLVDRGQHGPTASKSG